MAYPSGAFIGSNAIITLVIPLCVKAVLGEAADSRLAAPMRSLEVYAGGMSAMLLAAVVSRSLRARRPLLSQIAQISDLRAAYYGAAIVGLIITPLPLLLGGSQNGSILAFLNQVNRFPVLAFLLGVAYTVRRTAGRRSVSVPLALGLIGTSAVGRAAELFQGVVSAARCCAG